MSWIVLLPILLAIANRLRGSDGEGRISVLPVSFLGTLMAAVLLAATLKSDIPWYACLLIMAAYFFGEAAPGPDWGIACESIINHRTGYRKQYCLLAIRGLIWWAPVFAVYGAFRSMSWGFAVMGAITTGLFFPVCMNAGRSFLNWEYPYLRSAWEWGEFLYGFAQGVIIAGLLLQMQG